MTKKAYKKIMKGGEFTAEDRDDLHELGFTENQINDIESGNIPLNEVMQKYQEISNNITQNHIAELVTFHLLNNMNNSLNWDNISMISNNNEDDPMDINELNISDDTLDLNNTSNIQNSLTDMESINNSIGGKKNKKSHKKTHKKTLRKKRKTRKTKKQRGGMCYGTGVGSNCNNPNQSIYNTNMLQLFPYKPS